MAVDFIDINVAPVGNVIHSAIERFRSSFKAICFLVLAINLPMNFVLELIPFNPEEGLGGVSEYYRAQSVLEFLFGTIAYLSILHIVLGAHHGEKVSAWEAFRRSAGNYGSALWALFLSGLGLGVGLLLLVVPGIALFVLWLFALPMIVVGNASGGGSLGASYRFVKGRWWRFAGRVLVLAGLQLAFILVLSLFSLALPETYLVGVVWMTVVDLGYAFFIVAVAELFLQSGGNQIEMELTVSGGETSSA